jgi:pimeloyl-ACP methyl ester carboxylesterase
LATLARPDRGSGIVFIAPAPDFTERLMWPSLSADARKAIENEGEWLQPSEYGFDPYPITKALIDDGRTHCVMDGPVALQCPVRILQGMRDPDVPWQHALEFAEQIASDDVTLTLIKDGDHRLSDDQNLARLVDTVEALCWEVDEGVPG